MVIFKQIVQVDSMKQNLPLLKEDHYKIYFADDVNSDGTFDIGAASVYANLTLPCEKWVLKTIYLY